MKLRKHPSRFGLAVGASLFRFPSVFHKFIETLTIALCFLGAFSAETWAQPSGASAFPRFAARSESEARPRAFAHAVEAPSAVESASFAPLPASGGPDAFGYEWIDSDSPGGPTFQWVEISTLGTALNLTDDGFATVSLPFPFSFYGSTKNSVVISNNGYLTFGTNGTDRNNDNIPDTASPNDVIAPFWDNLQPGGGNVYHYFDSANNRFIVQYNKLAAHGDPSPYTFEVILQANGQIIFQYLSLGETLDRCTVGIENAAGTTGLQVVADDDYLHNNLAIRFATPNPLPTITSAAPNAGNRLQTLNVVLTGTGYATGVTSVNFGAGITLNTMTINSATQLTANITITPAAATGPRNVQVTNAAPGGGTATLTNGFTVNNPLPTLTGAAPNTGALGQTMDVVLTGTNFISGVSLPSFGADVTVNTATVNSSSQLTANITIGSGATTGPRNVTVTNPAPGGGTATLTNGFAINNSVPTITSAAPNTGTRTQTLNVVLTGTNYVNGVTTVSFGNEVTVNSAIANSATQITANITIGAAAVVGARDVVVTNPAPGGGSATLTSGFTITNPAPTLTSVTPNLAGREQTLNITLIGSGFLSGVTVANFGANITVNSATVNPAGTELVANITVAGNAALGARDVSVTNPAPGGGTATLAGSLTINNPVPTLTSVNPPNANQGQTLDVVFTGSGFLSGATTANFGADITINSTTVNSGTQLTANITVGASTALGARNVSVNNPAPGGGTATLTNGFAIGLSGPTLTSIAPSSGQWLATLDVVFTGANFVNGATTVNMGADITINSVTVNSSSSLTANVTIAASATLGARDVSVTNPPPGGGTATLTNGFTVVNPAPTLTGLAPTNGNRGETLNVILTGTHFVSNSSVNFGSGITVNSATINSSTQITANITIAANATTGPRDVTVTNAAPGGGAATVTSGFSVTNPLPALTSINPNSAFQGQTQNVVLTGSNFIDGVTTLSFGGEVTINFATINSATQITANVSVAPNAVVGPRDVTVTNPGPGGGTATLTNGFTINYNAPTLSTVVPNNGNRVQTLNVVLTGSNFIAGVTTVDFGGDIAINSATVNSSTQLTANITVLQTALTGLRNVSVTNPAPGGGTAVLNNGFAVNNPAPVLSIVDPNAGARSQTLDVVITGENFLSGITTVSFGSGITVNSLTVNSATELTANVSIAANATLGFRNVAVTNPAPGGGTATFVNAFNVVNPQPTLTSVAPALGLQGQTLDVVFTGSGFLTGVSSVNFGADVTINSTTINSLTQLTANITIGANATVGARDVSVSNVTPGGGTATLAGGFTVGYNAPTLTSLAPANANRLQTLNVVLTGSHFIAGVTTVDFGGDIAINSVTVNSSTQLTANISIAGNAALGVRNVSVTNPAPAGGTATLPNGFTIGNPSPQFTNLSPATAQREQTLDVIITGDNFVDGLTTVSFGANISVNATIINSATQLTANVTIAPTAATGPRNVFVTNAAPGGGTATFANGFIVNNAAPTLTNVAPAFVSRGQTVNVVLTGSHLYADVSTVNFGADITINSTTINSLTQITANITVGVNAALGARDVSVINPTPGGGTATLAGSLNIGFPTLTIANISPNSGNRLQTINVIVTGSDFLAGATSVSFGNDITVNSTTVNSASQLTANITIAPTAATGARDVTVTNPEPGGGSATLPNGFTVNNPAPALTSLSPNLGSRLQTLDVVLSGNNFIAGTTTVSFGNDVTINTITINSATQLTANVTIGVNAALGSRDVTVTNAVPGGGSATLTNGFTVNNPAPVLTSLDPALGLQGQTLNVVLTGNNFIAGVSSVNFGSGITINTTTINSATQITANLSIAANAPLGTRDVTVTNVAPGGGASTLVGAFTVGFPTLTLTSVNPVIGNRLQTLEVVLSGSNFVAGTTTASFGADITVNTITVTSSTSLTANITINANAATGPRAVSVTNPDPGGSTATLNNSFIVNNPTPQLTTITPNLGGRGQTLDIAIAGDNFISGLTTANFGAGITVNTITVLTQTQMSVNLSVAPDAALGSRTVTVTNPAPGGGGVTFINGFTVANPTPVLTSIAPSAGLQGQTLEVVLTGEGFISGLSTVSFGNEITVNATTVNSGTQITANITIAANAAVGVRDVSVTNPTPGGGTAVLNAAFAIGHNAPTLTSLSPSVGARLQTMNVVLSGSNFINGVTTVDFGAEIAVNSVTVNTAAQLTANITIGANAALGTRSVSVTNPAPNGGTATLANSFTITNPAPGLSTITPNSGSREATLDVVLTGENFMAGLTSVSFGNDITINTTTINSATQLTANITITANAATGPRNVAVTNPAPGGGAATSVNGFNVTTILPFITSATPNAGNRLQTLDVVLSGNNFIAGTTTVSFGNDVTINTITINSATQLTANLTIGVNAALGSRDVTVTNAVPGGGSATLTNGFTVNNPAPVLTSLDPALGLQGQTLNVVLTGANFIAGVSSVNFGSGITVNTTTVNPASGGTQITANLSVAANATLGTRDVTVTNLAPGGGASTLAGAFTVGFPTLTLTSVNPVIGNRLQTLEVVLSGSNFVAGTTTASFGPDLTVNSITVTSSTSLSANITINANAATGPRAVSVTNPDPGGSTATLNNSFIVNNPTPQLTTITPNLGGRGQTLDIAIEGDNFISGLTTANFGAGITVNTITVLTQTQMSVNLSVAPDAALGSRTVTVTNPAPGGGGVTFINGFTVANPTPVLTSIAPSSGLQGQTLEVVLTGEGFISGLSTVSFGNEITVNTTTVNPASGGTQITANITIAANAAVGVRDVSVTNPTPGGGTAVLNTAFAIGHNAPTLTSLSPSVGARLQTMNVVLNGSNFINGVTTVDLGAEVTTNTVTVNTASQLTANITIGANAALGTRSVSVTNPAPNGGTATLANSFTITNPAPGLSTITPNSGSREATLDVVLTGENFMAGLTSVSFGNDITINSTTINSATQLTANITITANAATGPRNVAVTNPAPGGGAATIVNNFTVTNVAPTLTSIAPAFVSRGQTVNVVFSGSHFYANTTTANLGNDLTINAITVNSLNQLTVNITVGVNAALGARDVSVTNPAPGGGTATLAGSLTVGFPTLTITSVSPNSGNRLQTMNVVVAGSDFLAGATTVSFGDGITVNTTTVNSSSQITANITIAPTAALGPRDVTVTNPEPGGGGATLANGFTVNNPAVTLTTLTPTSGNRLQTLDVVLTGNNFIAGVTNVNFGNDVTINTLNINSATQLTANLTIAVNATLGARDVVVTNPAPPGGGGGSAVLTDGFTVNNPAAVLTSVNPTLGLQGQTLDVILTGNNFIAGVSSVSFGNGININTTTINSASQITANITIPANAALGARDVTVTNVAPGGGTSTLAGGFTVGLNSPTLTNVTPPLGSRYQTLDVTLSGSNFIAGVSTVNFGAGITINSTAVNSASQITANITITPEAATGARAVSVTNPEPGGATATLNNAFTVTNPVPSLAAVTPNNGSRGQSFDVLMEGTNFITGGTTVSFGNGIAVNTITVNTPEQMTVNITIAGDAALGARNLVVTNPAPGGGAVTFINGFTIANPAPVLTSIAPGLGLQGQTLNLLLTGNGFISGLSTVSLGNDITVNTTTVNSTTQLTVNVTIAANAIIGPREVSVTNAAPGGGTTVLADSFTVGYNSPTLANLSPNVGARLQNVNVVFTGTRFAAGVTTVDFGNDITVNSVTVNSATQLTANVTIPANAALGARDVTVTNPTPGGGSATLTNGFVVNNPVPVISSVAPNAGNREQTLDIVVTGDNFLDGVTSVTFGNNITVNATTINSATQLTANITIGVNAAIGPRNVLVTNVAPGGGTATFSNGFTVGVSSPILTSLSPTSGARLQTLDVALNGSNFMSGVTTVSFGSGVSVNNVTINSGTQLTASITIAGSAALGSRDVTVTNPPPDGGSSTLPNAFTVVNPVPQLTNIAPAIASQGQTLQVVLSGGNFLSGVTTVSFGNEVTINSTAINNSGTMTVDITVGANATTGLRSVSVSNPAPGGGTTTLESVFMIGNPTPTLTHLVPNTGNRLQTLEVVMFGSNFINGQTTVNFGNNINVNSITFNSSTQLTANLTIAVNAALGARDVTVSNPGPLGGTATLANGFTVGVAIPTLTSLDPTIGNRGQTLNVVMHGSNFMGGVTTVDFGGGITVNSTTVNSATQLTASISIAANAALGVRDVSVTNPNPGGGTATLTNAFNVGISIPTLASIAPASALHGQTLDVVLTGSNFINGVTVLNFGNDITINGIAFTSTQITANITIGNNAVPGPRDISVTNPGPGGGTATLANAFTINVIGPTLTSILPTGGNRGQTLDVIFTGTNFTAGVSTVSMGSDVTVNTVAINSTTQLTANVTIAANAALGARDVSVTNVGPGGGTATLPSAFTVGIAIPTLTSLTPNTGNRSQTLDVVMNGSNFSAGATTVDFGGDITVNLVNVTSATQLTANITIGANAALGVRDVSVTNTSPGGGTATLLNAFTVGGGVPTLTSIVPQSGNRGQTLNVVLTGTNFANGLTTISFGSGITVNSITFTNGTHMTANIAIDANAVLGARNVSVTNPSPGGGTATLPNAFTVGTAAPTLTSVVPQSGNRGQTLDVTLTGSNFTSGITSVSFGNEITINNTIVNSATQITANLTIAANATLGNRDVSVTNVGQGGGTATLPGAFAVGVAIPTLTSVSPALGNRTQTLDVVLLGSNFSPGITSASFGSDITVNVITVNNATQLTASITIGANAALGARDISVTNSGQGGGTATLPNAFTVGHAQPILTSVNPAFGNRGQTLDVVLTGNNFASGFTTVSMGNGVTVNNVNIGSATQMTVNLTIGANAALGSRDVSVTNPTPGGGTAIMPNAFTVGVSIPTLTSLTPENGVRGQTLNVTMTGTNFTAGVTTVSFGFDVTVNTVTVSSATQLTANISIAPNAALGSRDVSVTNAAPGGGTATLPNAFTIGIGAPVLTSISPTSGNRGQSLEVILSGSNFAAGLTTVNLGNDIAINSIIINSATQLTASITIAVNAVLGARDVSVTNPAPGGGTATLEEAFTVGVAIPTLTSISPVFGNRGQTLEVTMNGSNFASGLTTVSFGEGITVNAVNVISFSQMAVNITIAANAALGSRDVSATNPSAGGGTVTLRAAFTVGVTQPTLTSLNPTEGARGQTLDVVMIGTNFVAGVSTVSFGNDITVNTTSVNSSTQITANISIAANANFGVHDVSVTNMGVGGGTATLPGAFNVLGSAPTLTSIAPTSGNRGTTLDVVLTGTNFVNGVTSASFGNDINLNTVTFNSATRLTVNITIGANAVLGARDVSVTNSGAGGGTATLPNAFTVGISLPGLASVSPAGGNRGQTLTLTLIGSNFATGVSTVDLGNDITINTTTVNSSTQITASITIGANATLGSRDVSVINSGPGGGTATLPNAFTVGTSIPTLTSVTPSSSQRGQTLDVVLTGSNFIPNNTSVNFGSEITVNSVIVTSSTELTANITIAANATLGARDVSVTNPPPGGGTATLVNGFTVGVVAPTLTSVAPNSANRLQTLDVVLTGTNFQGGITSVSFGNDILINTTIVNSSTQLTANITVGGNAALGPRDVSVSKSGPGNGTAVLANGFTVAVAAPTIVSVEPASGKRGETLNVIVTGTNFFSGVSTASFGSGVNVTALTVLSATQMRATLQIDSLAALGLRDVIVNNSGPGGGSASLNSAFTVRVAGAAKFLVSGFIRTSEGMGVSGVVLEGLPENPATDASGYYQALVNPGFTGEVRPVKGGYSFAPASRSYNNVQSDRLDEDYTALLETVSFAYPNPFNPQLEAIQIRFVLKTAVDATLEIMDARGDLVREIVNPGGAGRTGELFVSWDGRNGRGEMVANGIYFYVITTSSQERITGKIAVLR